MQRYILFVVAVLLGLSWLSPYHYTPWLTFSSELLAYAAALCLLGLYIHRPLLLTKMHVPLLIMVLIPLIQWVFGIEFYFNKALLSSLYLFAFAMMVILGSNLSHDPLQKQQVFTGLCYTTLIAGLISVVIALLQWLNLEQGLWGTMQLRGNRPYANFAQPNNMATFLLMALMACIYLFEKRKLATLWLFLGASLLIFTIALSQSRTPWVACIVLSVYLILQRHQLQRFRVKHMLFGVALYTMCLVLIPALNAILVQTGYSHSVMTGVIERANSSHSRFNIWMQMIYAIQQQPWFGYGWNQTSVAQLAGADFLQHNERTNSAHNWILEMLVWN
ncbi:MAG: O-antigen ligase family protein, partial [Acinetobacter sp.]